MGLIQCMALAVCSLVVFSSCANERKVTYSKNKSRDDLSRFESDVKFVKGKNGELRPNQDKRSQFDGKSEFLGNRDFRGKDYTAKSYRKERWGGMKEYGRKAYGGKTDGSRFQHSPEFVQQQARVQGQVASMSGQQYGTNGYQVGEASDVSGAKRFGRPSDAQVDFRRRVYKQPMVIDKKDYSGMSIEQSKSLLGR